MAKAIVKFGADTTDLQAGIGQAAAAMNGFGSQVYAAFNNANVATNGFGAKLKSFASEAGSALQKVGTSARKDIEGIGSSVGVSSLRIGVAAEVIYQAARLIVVALGAAAAAAAVSFGESVGHAAAQMGETTVGHDKVHAYEQLAQKFGIGFSSWIIECWHRPYS